MNNLEVGESVCRNFFPGEYCLAYSEFFSFFFPISIVVSFIASVVVFLIIRRRKNSEDILSK